MTQRSWHLWRLLVAAVGTALPLWAQVSVVTERYDNSRTGSNLGEISLNTSNVNVTQFGLLYSYAVDGSIQAQPLYVPNLTIPGSGTFNVLFVVTMNDVIYAFNADSNSTNGGILWSRDLRNPSAGVTPLPIADIVAANNLNIVGNVGIESTPVIDLTSQTMYLVARTKEVSGSTTNYVARLHALDITTGGEKFGGPVSIGGSVPGTGKGSSNGSLAFDPFIHNQRSSLALVNGTIVFSWASHEDYFDFHGWIFAFNAQTLQQTGIYCATPSGQEGGIWMAGRAPVIDASGNVYYATGNGDWDGNTNFGDSLLKLSTAGGALSLVDYFTPDTFATLDVNDLDLGSSGPLLIPGTDLLLHTGKDSIIRVMHTSNLGHEQSGNGQIVQNFLVGGEIRGGMVFWSRTTGSGPTMYVWGDYNGLKAFHFNGTTFNTTPLGTSSIVAPDGRSGGVLTLSANGDMPGTGIVWSSMPLNADGDHGTVEGVLRAFNADDLSNELWDSEMNARDDMGLWPKYSAPTVVNGKVYMASFSNFLNVYGLLTQPGPPLVASLNPASGAQSATLSVAVHGSDFQSGAACGFGPGINVSSCAFDSTNQLTAFITISPGAPLGTHDVTVVNPDLQSGTLAGGFSVTSPPVVTSVSPSSGGQGQLITVVIQGSNFQNGAVCSFGAGTVVNSCAFNSSSQLTATVAIRATATPGLRDVTVTDPDNQNTTLKGGFSVTPVAISPMHILLIQKATFSLQPSSSGTVTLALPKPAAEGDTLIVGVSFWPLDLSSVTDSSGDTFTRGLPTPSYHDVNGSPNYNNFYYTYSAGGATSITLNFTGASTYLLVAVAEVAGLDSVAPLDQTAYNESLTAAQNWSSGAVTTTAANEYLFSWAATEASNPNCSAPGGGWTIETQTNDSEGATVCLLDQIVSTIGPYQASVAASTAQNYAMEIATFVAGSSKSATGDFDGDGKTDTAVFRPSSGQWFIIPSSNPGTPMAQSWGLNGDIPVPGDYDGDGKTDFAVWRPSSGQWFIIPSSNPGTPMIQSWGLNGDVPVPGDYDGDVKTDFAVWRPSSGQWFIIPSSNPGTPMIQSWGLNEDVPVPGDYDGDGKTDFAVWRTSTGTWYIVPSSNPGTPIVQSWGLNGDIPVPGDYDGDGKTDFAVWRPSAGAWYIIPSSNPGAPIVQSWGLTGDIPVPGDYDGDRKTDFAVWRPSTGAWYIIPSSNPGTPIDQSWGLDGDAPIEEPVGQQ